MVKEHLIKDFLEYPRACKKCNQMTMDFRPSRVKRNDWICNPCDVIHRRTANTTENMERTATAQAAKQAIVDATFKRIEQLALF